MSEIAGPAIRRGQRLLGRDGRRIGTVDDVFADYLLVRTSGLLPVDLYIPMPEVKTDTQDRLLVDASAEEAYQAWHRPLKRAPHD
ncbi:MAG TPA: PRC-barrel domain-containing protein [Candidatus Limnocylindrales bacterium]|nr:PRC-barrel domain-containing protein [Candidatus Limnocylindrales bacterium]